MSRIWRRANRTHEVPCHPASFRLPDTVDDGRDCHWTCQVIMAWLQSHPLPVTSWATVVHESCVRARACEKIMAPRRIPRDRPPGARPRAELRRYSKHAARCGLESGLRYRSSMEVAVWTVFADTRPYRPHVHASGRRSWHEARIWVREALCGLRGHDFLLHFESQRICLECPTCGHRTPGWQLATSRRARGG